MKEGEFGSIVSLVKHGFAREHAMYLNTIKSADQLIVLPDLYAMGIALFKEFRVLGHDFVIDP
jgi:hypothetical protein